MKVSDLLLTEERQKDWKYVEKRTKGALTKVILELEGHNSGAMSRLMTRYKRLDVQWKLMEERRNEVNRQVKEVADRVFDAEDALSTRVIETVSYTVMLTKATPASEKEDTPKTDYESAFAELSRLVPELEAKAKEILKKYTELVPPKDTPSALKYTAKVEEGLADTAKGWIAKAKAFAKEMFNWGKSYDAKLDAFRRKYKLKAATLKEAKWSDEVDTKWTPPEGLFTKSADHIARKLKAASKDLKQAMSRLNFYINRAGGNLSDKDHARLEHAREILHNLYEDLREADEHTGRNKAADDMERDYGWYIVRVKDNAIGAGPFGTLPQARNSTDRYAWFDEDKYDFLYGYDGGDCDFHEAPQDVPRTKGK